MVLLAVTARAYRKASSLRIDSVEIPSLRHLFRLQPGSLTSKAGWRNEEDIV